MKKAIKSIPRISIIIPTYNAANFIEQAIKSVIGQTYSNVELIIVDGASTDHTLAILEQYKEDIDTMISEPDNGVYDAMNKGIGVATGEWIYFLGSDDVLYDSQVLTTVFTASCIKEVDVVYGNVKFKESSTIYDGPFDIYKLFIKNISHQAIFTKRSVFSRIGTFDTAYKLWADYDFNIRWFTHDNINHAHINVTVALYATQGLSSAQEDQVFLSKKVEIFSSLHHKYPPKVSVVIPNYNHAIYLVKRIDSVLNQTFPFFELILMDDCSTDNSREVIETYAGKDSRIRIIYNEQNSGSTFKQWNKGVKEAKGEYIWLAESDDYADPTFLAELIPHIDGNSAIGLIYCQSWNIDEYDNIQGTWEIHTKELNATKWKSNFRENGQEMIKKYMLNRNVIPNASAVLFRKKALLETGEITDTMKLNGDWLLYINLMLNNDVAFIAKPLNYFRTHTTNVRSKTAKTGQDLKELSEVIAYALKNTPVDGQTLSKVLHGFIKLWIEKNKRYDIPPAINGAVYRNMAHIDKFFYKKIIKRLFFDIKIYINVFFRQLKVSYKMLKSIFVVEWL